MIVPRSKLLLWVAIVVLPFSVVATAEPAAVLVALSFVALFAALVLVDAAAAPRALNGIAVELPQVFRMSKDRPAKLAVRVRNPSQKLRSVRLALSLPDEVTPETEELAFTLPSGTEWSSVLFACVANRRGRYRVGMACVETPSPLGFWAVRKQLPTDCELRIYPNLLTERKQLAALFLNRGPFGLHAQRQVGKGRDFEKLREYVPGDSFDEVHWKATARRGHPITKVFQIERTQEVYVVVDASRLSGRVSALRAPVPAGDGEEPSASTEPGAGMSDTLLERFVTAALVLGLAAEQQGDLFGLLTFSDRVEKFVRARNGKAHYNACREALYTLQSRTVTPDFDELCSFIRLRMRRRALLVFLTSLDDPALAESFVRNMDLIRRQHLVLVNMIQPPATQPLFSDGAVTSVDELYQRLGGHLQWSRLQEVGKTLQRRGVQFSLLGNERLSADLVSQYLNIKRRQLL